MASPSVSMDILSPHEQTLVVRYIASLDAAARRRFGAFLLHALTEGRVTPLPLGHPEFCALTQVQ